MINDKGELSRYLRIDFCTSDGSKSWEMSMGGYINKANKRFDLHEDVKPLDVPMDQEFVLTTADFIVAPTVEIIREYRSLIGSIGFAAVSVRYDISYCMRSQR